MLLLHRDNKCKFTKYHAYATCAPFALYTSTTTTTSPFILVFCTLRLTEHDHKHHKNTQGHNYMSHIISNTNCRTLCFTNLAVNDVSIDSQSFSV